MNKKLIFFALLSIQVGLHAQSDESISQKLDRKVDSVRDRISEEFFIKLGGLQQWITIRGINKNAPVLLLVHGGPGDVQSIIPSAYAIYERDFLIVQWDQRGSGKSYGEYKDNTPNLNLEQLTDDGIELANYLKNRFKKKVIVLGHSFGTAIATEMVTKRPELFAAYVGTGQIASWSESVQWQFDFLKNKAVQSNDTAMLNELLLIDKPDPTNAEQYFKFTRPLRKYFATSDAIWLKGLRELATVLPKADLENLGNGMDFSGRVLLPIQMKEKLSTTSLMFKVPYLIIQGQEDIMTPTEPALKYFNNITAPKKGQVVLENAGHFALVTHSAAFKEALIKLLSETRLP